MSEAAQRFRAELAGGRSAGEDGFSRWKRDRAASRLAAWMAALALLSPGAICFVAHAPMAVSTLVEAAGFGANAWLRRQRRRHLSAISAWTPPAQ